MLHSLFGLTENITDKIKNKVPFVKILGFSTKGQEYLNYLKKSESYNERKILTSNRNCIKSDYINIGYPIIKKD